MRNGRRLVALLMAVVALGACASAAVPAASTPAALPATTPAVTPAVTPSPKPSPTVAIVKITPIPGAPDSGTIVQLVAANARWDKTSLAAPAGKVWHVQMTNTEKTVPHNVTVASGPTFEERIYQSPNFLTGTRTFDIPALPAGSYFFICTLHANTMTGTLTIK